MSPNLESRVKEVGIMPGPLKLKKDVIRDKIFTRFDEPFGIPEHLFNRCLLLPTHLLAVYCMHLTFTNQLPKSVVWFELLWAFLGGLGITVGCHRFWSHKTFKANLPLQLFLMAMQTVSGQHPIYQWCLDHRIHHRYTDTDADPHNSKRGFWHCHIGWLLIPRSKEYLEKSRRFDMPDLENDPVVRFQSKYYWTLVLLLRYTTPILITYYTWDMSLFHCICSNCRQYVMSRHFTWSVNSFAHMFGDKPYDKSITSAENALVSLVAIGEGWHNYHHTFPWDYKASEFGGWKLNPSTFFIDFCASMGWAYDLKTVSQKLLKQRLRRTGDGSHLLVQSDQVQVDENHDDDFAYSTPEDVSQLMKTLDKPIWGWDDSSIPEDFRKVTKILRSLDGN